MAITTTMMLVATVVMTAVAAAAQASAQAAAGRAEQDAANARQTVLNHQATQARQIAGQERASAQRGALEMRRGSKLLSSKALARAAASGAGAYDPSVENILGNIGAEGEFRALNELFTGEERARNLETQAATKVFEGNQEARAGKIAKQIGNQKAFGTVFSGATKIAGSYSSYASPDTTLSGTSPSFVEKYGYGYGD